MQHTSLDYGRALESRAEELRYWGSEITPGALADVTRWLRGERQISDAYSDPEAFRGLVMRTLVSADVYYVARDITDFLWRSGAALPSFELTREMVPGGWGYVSFERPIYDALPADTVREPGREDEYRDRWVHAVGWALATQADAVSDAPSGLAVFVWMRGTAPHDVVGLGSIYQIPLAPKPWDAVHTSPNHTQRNACAGGEACRSKRVEALLVSLFAFMQQRILVSSQAQADRHARKRIARHAPELAERGIRVVHLRAVEHAGHGASAEGRAYECRWLVRGHWRRQWYGSRGVHSPRWIAPHMKGPDDKPLKPAAERVFAVVR